MPRFHGREAELLREVKRKYYSRSVKYLQELTNEEWSMIDDYVEGHPKEVTNGVYKDTLELEVSKKRASGEKDL